MNSARDEEKEFLLAASRFKALDPAGYARVVRQLASELDPSEETWSEKNRRLAAMFR